VPLSLGSRALDILIVLTERAGEVVSQRELIARVWRDLVVLPSNLRVHVAGLRKALGDSEKQPRYIANIPGLGYCFVAPVERAADGETVEPIVSPALAHPTPDRTLPAELVRMVGRDDAVQEIAAALLDHRFLSIVGPGGMGKTTVAVCVAHTLSAKFAGEVCFVDIGAITDPALVVAAIASALGLTALPEDAAASLMARLRPDRMLLVLDNCEHVIEAVASLAEQIFCEAPDVHLLATSRETLRVEGEHAYKLPPLGTPPPGVELTAAQALSFAAVRLFVERATASGSRFELSDQQAATVAGICRRLDGIALAIELAAGRVGTYGVEGTAMLLANRLALQWRGRRTAQPRHQTLRALMDWSYDPLSRSVQLLLQRLSTFAGTFTLEDAQAAAADPALSTSQVILNLDSLVSKSLVIAALDGGTVRYRILETIRDYAAEKSQAGGPTPARRRHPQVLVDLGNGWMFDPPDDHDVALGLVECA
jgi:predicted ATPase/DNA-binding winged helix-turn-helix (wHTH) protein